MKIVITKIIPGHRVSYTPHTEFALTMGDDDQYNGVVNDTNILRCIEFGVNGQEEADHGVLKFDGVEIHFDIEK